MTKASLIHLLATTNYLLRVAKLHKSFITTRVILNLGLPLAAQLSIHFKGKAIMLYFSEGPV